MEQETSLHRHSGALVPHEEVEEEEWTEGEAWSVTTYIGGRKTLLAARSVATSCKP